MLKIGKDILHTDGVLDLFEVMDFSKKLFDEKT